MQIVARRFTHAGFRSYLDSLKITPWAKFVVVHNTSAPDIKLYRDDWMKRPNWTPEQWLRNLTSYYSGMGWNGAPHLFVPPQEDTILVLNSLLVHGTHTPSWNGFSYGVETVGEFEREAFDDPTRANLVAALAALHQKAGLTPLPFSLGGDTLATAGRGLHFHKEDVHTTHRTCPGRNMVKADLVNRVMAAMGHDVQIPEDPHTHDVPMASQEADTSGMSIQELTSVKWLQAMLNRWNPKLGLAADGVRGKKTMDATRQFQLEHGLVADGIAGPVTRAALKKLTA